MATTESLYGRFSGEAALDAQRQCPRKKEPANAFSFNTIC